MPLDLEYARLIAAVARGNGLAAGEPVSRRRHRPGTRRVIRPNVVRLIPGATRLPFVSSGATL